MKKTFFALSLCALAATASSALAPRASAALAHEVCYTVTCRGAAHKPFSTRACCATDAVAQEKVRDVMNAHRGLGHATTMSRVNKPASPSAKRRRP